MHAPAAPYAQEDEAIEISKDVVPASGERSLCHTSSGSIALFGIDDGVYAINDSCPHAGASLFTGTLNGRAVQCRAHGLTFDLSTGCMRGAVSFGVRAYRLEVRDDRYFLVPREPLGLAR
jgi:nitrite reductase/ring-hydroxylating ferredoxin subunit